MGLGIIINPVMQVTGMFWEYFIDDTDEVFLDIWIGVFIDNNRRCGMRNIYMA